MIDEENVKAWTVGSLLFLLVVFMFFTFVWPFIYVWQQSKEGEAELAKAEYSRQIATCEANAKKESSKALAEAEVIRAEGVAKANKIIGESLKENEQYLRYLWINTLETNNKQVIYIPTEANLPILEASRLKQGV